MEHYMAGFGQGFVQATVLSENNAVKWKLSISGSCTKSTVKPYVKLQNMEIGPQTYSNGMNIVVYDTEDMVKVETKSYNFTSTPSAVNQAFMTYIDSLPKDKLVIMVSNGKLRTCSELTAWFKSRNSQAWPETKDIEKFDAAYSAFYITNIDSISSEHILFNDGVTAEAINPHLDVVFDYYQDIGATGVPKRIAVVDGIIESNGVQELELVRLPSSELISPISDYNLRTGDMFYLKFSIKTDVGPGGGDTPEGATRCSIRWFNDEELVSFVNIENGISFTGQWQTFERYIEVPGNANGFTVYFSRTNIADYGAVNNVTMVEVPREEWPMLRAAEFGVNGVRMNSLVDGKDQELMILADSSTDDRGIVRVAEFREI